MPRKRALPILADENVQQSLLYRDLAAIAGFEDGDLLNHIYDLRIDGEENNVYVKKIEGYAALGNDVNDLATLGGSHYYKSDGTKSRYAVFDGAVNSDIYLLSGGTWTAQSRSLTTGKTAEFVQFKDDLYVTNATDAFQKYDGTSWSSLASGTPYSGAGNIATYVLMYKNMLISANSTNNPNRLWVSDVGTPETVGANNFWDFEQAITGIAVLGSMLVVFLRTQIHVMQGVSPESMTRTVTPKSKRYGCLAHRSIQQAELDGGQKFLVFLSNDTVRAFDGEKTTRVGFDYLKNQFPNVNDEQYDKAAAAIYDNKYWLAVPWSASTVNNKVLVYDLRFNIWTRIDNWGAAWFDVYDNGSEVLNFGESSADGRVWEYPSGTTTQKPSASTAITCQYTTRNIDFGAPYLIKKHKKVYVQTKAIGAVTMKGEKNIDELGWSGLRFGLDASANIDLTASGSTWGSFSWGAANWGGQTLVSTPENRGLITGTGKLIKFRFSDSQTTDETEIYNIQPFYIPKKIK